MMLKSAPSLFALLVLMSSIATAQREAKENATKDDLKLELSTTSERHCASESLPLKLNVTNQSDRDVQIAKLGIWLRFRYEYVGPDGKRTGASLVLEPDWSRIDLPENSFFLKPKESYLSTSKFFESRREGKYAIRLFYNGFESNKLEFEVVNCDQGNL
jgi:hypothetical protein